MRNVSPWLVLLLGLVVGLPAGRLAMAPPSSPEKPAPSATPAPAATSAVAPAAGETFSCKGTVAAPPPPWCEPVRLLGDFLGRPPREKGEREKLVADLAEAAQQQGYDL